MAYSLPPSHLYHNIKTVDQYHSLQVEGKKPILGLRGRRLVILKYDRDSFLGRISQTIQNIYYSVLSFLKIISQDSDLIAFRKGEVRTYHAMFMLRESEGEYQALFRDNIPLVLAKCQLLKDTSLLEKKEKELNVKIGLLEKMAAKKQKEVDQLANKDKEIQKQQKELKKLQDSILRLNEVYQSMTQKVEELSDQLENFKATERENNQLQLDIQSLHLRIARKQREIEIAEDRLSDLNKTWFYNFSHLRSSEKEPLTPQQWKKQLQQETETDTELSKGAQPSTSQIAECAAN